MCWSLSCWPRPCSICTGKGLARYAKQLHPNASWQIHPDQGGKSTKSISKELPHYEHRPHQCRLITATAALPPPWKVGPAT
ncbi:hypothetical protein J4714_14290 [Staphylococcus epidermidis]|nr:hypothetical protein [Staphylococcus epidermidis]